MRLYKRAIKYRPSIYIYIYICIYNYYSSKFILYIVTLIVLMNSK